MRVRLLFRSETFTRTQLRSQPNACATFYSIIRIIRIRKRIPRSTGRSHYHIRHMSFSRAQVTTIWDNQYQTFRALNEEWQHVPAPSCLQDDGRSAQNASRPEGVSANANANDSSSLD